MEVEAHWWLGLSGGAGTGGARGGAGRVSPAGHLGDARLLLQYDLRVAGDACAERRRQSKRLVEGVGVQRLRAAEDGRHRLHRRPHDVVVRVLRRSRAPWKKTLTASTIL